MASSNRILTASTAFAATTWRADWLKIGLVAGLIAALYAEPFSTMAKTWWNDDSASHGLLIPPFALYLAWKRRRATLSRPACPDNRGLAAIAAACMIFLVGHIGADFFLTRISVIVLLFGLSWTFWGMPRTRTLLVPLALLATMIPLPLLVYNSLAAPLQLLASEASAQLLQSCGVTVYRDGNILYLAGMSLGVAEACSGLRAIFSLAITGLLLGLLKCHRRLAKIIVLFLAVPIAIGINIVRVAGTAVLSEYNRDFATGFYHLFSGWLVFVAGLTLLFLGADVVHRLFDRAGSRGMEA